MMVRTISTDRPPALVAGQNPATAIGPYLVDSPARGMRLALICAVAGILLSTLIASAHEVEGTEPTASLPSGTTAPVAPARAVNSPQKLRTLLGPAPPYVPREMDYSLELGVIATGDEELFWVAGNVGKHLGTCIFTESETCQQYVDFIGGAGVREAESHGLFLGSLRWQYVNFPDRYSPFWRLFVGPSLVARGADRGWRGIAGGGWGVTNYLHDQVDLRLELRSGVEDTRPFAQGLLAVQVKADRLLEYFAVKLKDLGVGAVGTLIDATGTAVQATGEGIGGIVEGVSAPFKDEEAKPKEAK